MKQEKKNVTKQALTAFQIYDFDMKICNFERRLKAFSTSQINATKS